MENRVLTNYASNRKINEKRKICLATQRGQYSIKAGGVRAQGYANKIGVVGVL